MGLMCFSAVRLPMTMAAISFSGEMLQHNAYSSILMAICRITTIVTVAYQTLIQFRKFKFLSDVEQYGDDADSRFGVIAQEIETIFPGLIKECPDFEDREIDTGEVDEHGDAIMKEERIDLGTTTKGVKYSVLSQIGLKVVQELGTRLEAAEARIAALESA